MTIKAAKADWGTAELASTEPNYRMIWRSWGMEKTGKNHLGLSAPGPIAVHCLDILGLEGTVEKFRREKEIHVFKYRFNIRDNSQDDAIRVRDQFLEDLEISLRNARTVQIDETELWEVFRYAEFGDKSDRPNNYDKLYADYREWIHQFDGRGINLQLIQKTKESWEQYEELDKNQRKVTKSRPSGVYKPTGYKELRSVVQANIEHSWTADDGFVIRVENCRQNMAIAGNRYTQKAMWNSGAELNFTTLAQFVFPGTDDTDWSS